MGIEPQMPYIEQVKPTDTEPMTDSTTLMKISGTNLRMALVDRRGELIRCSSITKDNTFDEQIATLDDIIEQIWMAKNVELTVVN